MIANLITLADFPEFVPFSVNTDASLVNPHIREAQTFDVEPVATLARLRAVAAELPGVAANFKPTDTDAPDFLQQAAAAGWADTTLARIWYVGIRPLLVCESARRMLLWHGFHVSPAGLHTVSDPSTGAQPVSGTNRAELRADLASKANHYRARLETALRLAYPTSYATACTASRRRRGSGGAQLSAV